MDKKKRSYLRIIGCGCTFVFLFLIVWIGIVWLNRPAYIEPDTSTFETGDVFFSVGDSWESVAVRTLSGSLSRGGRLHTFSLRNSRQICRGRKVGSCVDSKKEDRTRNARGLPAQQWLVLHLHTKSTLHGGHPRYTTVGGDAGKEQGAIRFQFRPLHIESTVLHGNGGQGF